MFGLVVDEELFGEVVKVGGVAIRKIVLKSVFFFFTLVLLSCQEDSSTTSNSERAVDTNSWQEFCKSVDCSQFPDGYITYDHGDNRYYFPVYAQRADDKRHQQYDGQEINFPIPQGRFRQYGEKYGQFTYIEKLDADGRVLKAYRKETADKLQIDAFLRMKKEGGLYIVGLFDDNFKLRPPNASRTDKLLKIYADLYHPTFFKPEKAVKATKLNFSGFYEGKYNSINELLNENFPSFNDDFYLVYQRPVSDHSRSRIDFRGFDLLSKKPVFFGRHVFINCYSLCALSSVFFPDDDLRKYPVVHITNVKFSNYKPVRCSDNAPDLSCDLGTQDFKVVIQVFKQLENLLIGFQKHGGM